MKIEKKHEFHADKGDLLILISSSGMSKNITDCVKKNKDFFHFSNFLGF